MKKTLIVFAGKRGTTKEAAGRLAAALNGASTLNLAWPGASKSSLDGYERVVLAGSSYMGQWNPALVDWASARENELMAKDVAILELGMNKSERAAAQAQPRLSAHAQAYCKPGGCVHWEELTFIERMIIKTVSGKKGDASNLDWAELDAFGQGLKGAQ
jgi:menaquinone-dependent protoporphyrinogen oxidase